jgi:hypothetical protein
MVRRGDDIVIRADVHDLGPDDVRVSVSEGHLEIRVPEGSLVERTASTPERAPAGAEQRMQGREGAPGGAQPEASLRGGMQERLTRPSGGTDAEPPISAPDEQDFWDAQKPLISEDRRTSIHLEGYSDEQANAVLEALGEDASEEAQGGSATGSDVISEHGGFPSRNPEEDEPEDR